MFDPHRHRRVASALGVAATLALVLAACADTEDIDGGGGSEGGGGTIAVGTTDTLFNLDPAGAYDNGSLAVQIQVFPMLVDSPYGSPDVEPNIAEPSSPPRPSTRSPSRTG